MFGSRLLKKAEAASTPPAEAPMPTTGNGLSAASDFSIDVPAFFNGLIFFAGFFS
jgi:hypothetical protein